MVFIRYICSGLCVDLKEFVVHWATALGFKTADHAAQCDRMDAGIINSNRLASPPHRASTRHEGGGDEISSRIWREAGWWLAGWWLATLGGWQPITITSASGGAVCLGWCRVSGGTDWECRISNFPATGSVLCCDIAAGYTF